MYREILNIVNDYIDNNKNPDKNFIAKIIDIFNKRYYKNKTVKKIKLDKYEIFSAKYSPLLETVFFDTSFYNDYTCKSNVLEILLSIFHEYVHVIQYENMNSKSDSICNKLVNISFTVFIKKNSDDFLHDYIPAERLANISSVYRLINIMSLDKDKFFSGLIYYKRKFFQYLIHGYKLDGEKISYPLETLFNKTNLGDYTDGLAKISTKLSFQERLLYGFPITTKEYELIRRQFINAMYDEEEYKKKILNRR